MLIVMKNGEPQVSLSNYKVLAERAPDMLTNKSGM